MADNHLYVYESAQLQSDLGSQQSTPLAIDPDSAEKKQFTTRIPFDLDERLRNAVVALSGPPKRLTMAQATALALERFVQDLETKHNGGTPFPVRDQEPRPGRPMKRRNTKKGPQNSSSGPTS